MYINGPRIVSDGLVFCVDGANTKSYPGSGTTIVNLAGNTNLTGSLVNGPAFEGRNSGVLRFDGTNDHILVSSASADAAVLEPTTELTVGIFALVESKSSAVGGGYDGTFTDIVRKANANANGYIIRFANNNTKFSNWGITIGGTTYRVDDTVNGSYGYTKWFDQWTYFVGTYNDTTNVQAFYINAEQVGIATTARPALQHTGNLSIMANIQDGTQRFVKGLMGTTHIYNRALSQQEILQNYNALLGRFGG